MKNFIYAFALLVVAATGFVACDKSSDEVVLSDRCCITSFKVTALKREVHTTSTTTGADSVYYTTTNASTVRMLIDQRAGTITNLDLLPKGSLLDAVLVSLSVQGTAGYASINDTTSWTAYSTTGKDSIDFTSPVIFRVIATNGKSYRDYTVTLKVRDNDANGYTWTKICPIEGLSNKTTAKLLFHEVKGLDGYTFPLLFSQGTEGKAYISIPEGHHNVPPFPSNWTTEFCVGLSDARVQETVSFNNQLWMSSGEGQLYCSESGLEWTNVPQAEDQQVHLFAASETALYACVSDGTTTVIASSADGTTWKPATFVDNPFTNVSAAVAYTQTNGNRRVLVLSDVFDGDNNNPLFAWSLLEGSGEPWVPINDGSTEYPLPRWRQPVLTTYNNWLIAMGDKDWSGSHQALDKIYISRDNGLNWREDSYLTVPTELVGTSGAIAAAGFDKYIWIVAGGQLWGLSYNSYGE